jgi:hypothetical protein
MKLNISARGRSDPARGKLDYFSLSMSYLTAFLCIGSLAVLLVTTYLPMAGGTIERCQANCVAPDRRVGPTRPPKTRPHPWFVAPFPNKFDGFCKLGCQLFFSEVPTNLTCRKSCDFAYRYEVTVGYSDSIEQGIYECFDGCDIALQICQKGYYCSDGAMKPCPPGTFRDNSTDARVQQCIGCPLGRYRAQEKGTSAETCDKCPKGKYLGFFGGTSINSCIRCPAGTVAEEEGMGACKNITIKSNEWNVTLDVRTTTYYSTGIDFYRESIPFIGRW